MGAAEDLVGRQRAVADELGPHARRGAAGLRQESGERGRDDHGEVGPGVADAAEQLQQVTALGSGVWNRHRMRPAVVPDRGDHQVVLAGPAPVENGRALHTLTGQLRTSVSTIQWVTTGYLLALGIAVPLSVWILARFGGKRLWMFGLAVFLIGSIGSSLAPNAAALITWRVVQGAGGGIMLPLLTTLIMQAVGGKALGRTVTIVTLPALLGPILGPLIGGLILTQLSWRFMFWVNVPFCVIGLALAARYMPADRPDPASATPRLDLPGLILLPPGLAGIILGQQCGQRGRLHAPRRPRPARDRPRTDRGLRPLRPAQPPAARRCSTAEPPAGRFGLGGAVLLRVLPVRRDAAAAAVLPAGSLRGFGLGAVTIPVIAVAFLGLDKSQIAHSSVVTRTVQQLGARSARPSWRSSCPPRSPRTTGSWPARSTWRSGGRLDSRSWPCRCRSGRPTRPGRRFRRDRLRRQSQLIPGVNPAQIFVPDLIAREGI